VAVERHLSISQPASDLACRSSLSSTTERLTAMDESPVARTTKKPAITKPVTKKPAITKPAIKRPPVAKGEQRAYLQTSLADDARIVDRIAFEVLAERSDLLPSVERIIHGCPDEPTAERALLLFQAALTGGGDPNRNPMTAIAAATQAGDAG